MSRTTYGTLSYKWEMTLDVGLICDYLMEKCGIEDEIDEFEIDGNDLIIKGSDSCRASRYYDPGTYYDPPEEEITPYGGNDGIKDLKGKVLKALHEIPETEVSVNIECFWDDAEFEGEDEVAERYYRYED